MIIALGFLTVINLALTVLGASIAMYAPMMFDAGGQDSALMWGIFWSLLVFPAVALACVVLSWLFAWLRWRRVAMVVAAVPAACALVLGTVIFAI
jgi:hypothetical protein